MKLKILFVIIFLINSRLIFSQYLVSDTVFIKFRYDTIIPVKTKIDSILDKRNTNNRHISYTTKKKLLFIPIDQEICLQNPLSTCLENSLLTTNPTFDTLSIIIHHFNIDKFNGRFNSYYVLEADLSIVKNKTIKGFLTYNYKYVPKNKKEPKSIICENALLNWNTQFKLDLLSTTYYLNNNEADKPGVFLAETYKRPSFLNVTVGTVIGLDFWQIDGEIYFTRPETNESRLFRAGIIRYQNTPELEMIGFGKKSEHFYKRFNPNFALDVCSNFLIGINKWKNTESIKLQQVFQFSLSSNQSISFDRMNKSGWLLKAGLFENAFYIIEKPIKLQIGMYISTGYKF
jgi:hypothetical protein